MTIYYDSLSQSGMIEKNGHQLSFRNGEQIVILDSIRMMITDAPEIKNNQLFVSQKFIDDSENFFNQKSEMPFKVGAILIDAGHGGKDPGAVKTYKKILAGRFAWRSSGGSLFFRFCKMIKLVFYAQPLTRFFRRCDKNYVR